LSAAAPGALIGDVPDVVAIELVGVAEDVVFRLVKEAALPGVFGLWSRGILLPPPEL
jgi:hypothetical protein